MGACSFARWRPMSDWKSVARGDFIPVRSWLVITCTEGTSTIHRPGQVVKRRSRARSRFARLLTGSGHLVAMPPKAEGLRHSALSRYPCLLLRRKTSMPNRSRRPLVRGRSQRHDGGDRCQAGVDFRPPGKIRGPVTCSRRLAAVPDEKLFRKPITEPWNST